MSVGSTAALEPARAHALARQRPRSRGWRDDWFFFVAAWVVAAIVAYGFAHTLSQRLLHAPIPQPHILWLHATVFFGWVCVFITQTTLVRLRRVRWHRTLGVAGLVLGALMPPLGIATSLVMGRFNLEHALRAPDFARAFLAIPFNDMLCFTGTLVAAAWWRKRPDAHRRLLFMATSVLTAAAFARFPFITITALRWYAGVDLLLLLGVAHDLARHGRVHVAYALALPPILAGQTAAMWLLMARPHWWLRFAHHLIG